MILNFMLQKKNYLDSGCRDGSSLKVGTQGYGRLCMDSVKRSSMGSYLCYAINGIAPSVSKRIQLVVLCKFYYSTDFV